MRIPCTLTSAKGQPRTYCSDEHRLVIYDKHGNGWVGVELPEILDTLRSEGYTECFYKGVFVSSIEPIIIDDLVIDTYPSWVFPYARHMDLLWKRWIELEKSYRSMLHGYAMSADK